MGRATRAVMRRRRQETIEGRHLRRGRARAVTAGDASGWG